MQALKHTLLTFILLLGSMAGLQAQTAPPAPTPVKVNIKAQSLAAALNAWADQTGYMVLVPIEGGAKGMQAPRVNGTYTPKEALDLLLASSGLSYEFVNPKTVSIRASEKRGAAEPAAQEVSLRLADAVAAPASASEPAAVGLADESSSGELVVTGVRETGLVNQGVIPRQPNQAVRYEIIDREAIDRSGASSLQELLVRQLPQAANVGTDTQRTLQVQGNLAIGIETMTDTLDLRGFGSNQTLILVNGRRLYGSESKGPDISRIPLSAVERIEVLPSSGSAIYGANAMAGVVNIVLRKDYSGTGFEARFGTANGGAEEIRLALSHGMSFNEGRTSQSVFFEYKQSEALRLNQRDYHLGVLELNPPGSAGYVSRVVGTFTGQRATVVRSPAVGSLGIPGSPGDFFAGIPVGTDGAGLTPASFAATAGQAHVDASNLGLRNLVSPNESVSLFATLEHAIRGERLAAYVEANYRWADNSASDYEGLSSVFTLGPANPLNPFRNNVTPGFVGSTVIARVVPADVPRTENIGKQQTFRLVAGLKGQFEALGARPFKWAVDGSWDRNETRARNIRYQSLLRFAAANGLYNPLKDYTVAPMLAQSELEKLRINADFVSHPEIAATNWRLNGELFDAWGGPVLMSAGAEYRHEYYYNTARYSYGAGSYIDLPPANGVTASPRSSDSSTSTTRGSMAAYMEMIVPLVGADNRKPLLYALEVSAAMRHEKYDDFQAANPPMLALKWAPMRDLALRAQISEGFQPPTQVQLSNVPSVSTTTFAQYSYVDPQRPGLPNAPQIDYTYGAGDPGLKPETSQTLDAGIVLTPRWLEGLTINVAYFRYDKKDQPAVLSMAEAALIPALVVRGPNLPGDPVGVPGPIIRIDQPYVNLARQFADGIDYSIDYELPTAAGNFRLSGAATNTRRFTRQVTVNAPEVDTVGNLGFFGSAGVLKWRGKAGVSWQRQRWGASWTARYFDGYDYTNLGGTPMNASAPSTLEHDVQFSYSLAGAAGAAGWLQLLENARWSAGVMNVFDHAPPFIDNSANSWYSALNDPRQRFFYLNLRTSF